MTDALVSVIVPVYNVEAYLPHCLECIRAQSYTNLEIILVDDGSTDSSGHICDEYADSDPRARVIHHKTNRGIPAARNSGLQVAKGEYIYFMDSDDSIHSELIERLLAAMHETGLSLSACDYVCTDSLAIDTASQIQGHEYELIPTEPVVFEMLSRVERKWCVVWNKLYHRPLIDRILFHDYYSIEDQDFNIRVYGKIAHIAFIPAKLYYYRENPKSMTRMASNNPKRLYFNTMFRFRMLDYLSNKGMEKKYRAWVIGYGYLQMLTWKPLLQETAYESLYMQECKEILHDTKHEFFSMRGFPFNKKARFLLDWYFPKIYEGYLRFMSITRRLQKT